MEASDNETNGKGMNSVNEENSLKAAQLHEGFVSQWCEYYNDYVATKPPNMAVGPHGRT